MKKQFLILAFIAAPLCVFVYTSNHVIKTATIPHINQENITVEVSAGELFDKLTILEIKTERITAPEKLNNIRNELAVIEQTIAMSIPTSPALNRLVMQLKQVNEQLWKIEDDIRAKEAAQVFDQEFIDLARAVYFTNDKRGDIKREINKLLGSRLMEEKQYTNYEQK